MYGVCPSLWQSRAEYLVPCHWMEAPKVNSIVVGSKIRYDFHDFHGGEGATSSYS
jgi:hypothetical protein